MILFPDIKDCCNCNGCTQICPQDAIYKNKDEFGFVYPRIDSEKCIDCGLCQKVCAYQHIIETNTPSSVYVAVSNNKPQLKKSASGGIFAAIATKFLNRGAIVYGASIMRDRNKFIVNHIGISTLGELPLLQGSKYLLSEINDCFKEIRTYLNEGRKVLFSGTPCQCAGLKGFLRKDYPNLFLIDLICHGVPNEQLFNDFIDFQYGDLNEISGFAFRDKTKGWELTGRIDYEKGERHQFIPAGTSSYYALFLDAQIYRKNCYSCKYACDNRPGDITIGDYWGVQKQHPELIASGQFNPQEGISCIIVNTEKGDGLIKTVRDSISLSPTTYDKVAARNAQLVHPMKEGFYRDEIFKIYCNEGYSGVNRFYRKQYRLQRIIHSLLALLPYSIKNTLRRLRHS